MTTSLPRTIARFTDAGIPVIPLFYGSKRPAVRWERYQTMLPLPGQITLWFGSGDHYNAAVVTGWSGLTVLDFDSRQTYGEWQLWALQQGGVAAEVAHHAYRVETARGVHIYTQVAEEVANQKMGWSSTGRRADWRHWGEVKAKGGYVVIPPSLHPSGARYREANPGAAIPQVEALLDVIPEAHMPGVSYRDAQDDAALWGEISVPTGSDLFPASPIEEIRERISPLDLLGETHPTGPHWHMTLCPFHDDRNDSFWIDSEAGVCGCFAGCTPLPLDTIGLFARLHNVSNKEAIKTLYRRIAA